MSLIAPFPRVLAITALWFAMIWTLVAQTGHDAGQFAVAATFIANTRRPTVLHLPTQA